MCYGTHMHLQRERVEEALCACPIRLLCRAAESPVSTCTLPQDVYAARVPRDAIIRSRVATEVPPTYLARHTVPSGVCEGYRPTGLPRVVDLWCLDRIPDVGSHPLPLTRDK